MTTIGVGTEKGAWFLHRDDDAENGWAVDGPHLAGWRVTAFGTAPDGRRLAAVGSNWFGVSVHAADGDGGWDQVGAPAWSEEEAADGRSLEAVWTLATVADTVYAGVADGGLFRSTDLDRWEPVRAFNEHPSRPTWMPGLGGLCAHHVLADGPERLWVAMSSVGVLVTEDGGERWERRDDGVTPTATEESGASADGWCVHGLAHDPDDPQRLWRQEHRGVHRSDDGGRSWRPAQAGLPNRSGFGFPMVRDHTTGRLFVVPLHSDERRLPVDGRFAAWASDDDGDSWHVAGSGWPTSPTYTAVLRGAMAADGSGTVAAGTTGGRVWVTEDHGEQWRELPPTFPRIGAVRLWGGA